MLAVIALPLWPAGAWAQTASDQSDGSVAPARVSGPQRYATAARLADLAFNQAESAVIVTGDDYPDALAASYAAGRLDAPILLVQRDHVPDSTLSMLGELGVTSVLLVGGPSAISEQAAETLRQEGYPTRRIRGIDRYETAANVARQYNATGIGTLNGQRAALLASGTTFADALSAGPLAMGARLPLLLTLPDRPLPVVDEALEQLGVERVVVVGGTAAVSAGVLDHYRQRGYDVERFGGATRDQTAIIVADQAINRLGFSPSLALLARGDGFADALAASPHAGRAKAPLLLAPSPGVLGDATGNWFGARCPAIDVVRAVGGTQAVTVDTLRQAVERAEACTRFSEEVSRFTTRLLGKPDRSHNIQLAADYIDGDVVPAGGTYSLNEGTGRRTRARGFREVENGCISGGEAVDCVGGGVSQLGTTFMNAAWFAGIELRQWRQHSIYFRRYPVCHEATLSWGSLDVVIHNNSPHDILIDTFWNDDHVGVRFLSRPWASVDSWSQPDNPPSDGSFTSRCGRVITYPDGQTHSEEYAWTYDGTGF